MFHSLQLSRLRSHSRPDKYFSCWYMVAMDSVFCTLGSNFFKIVDNNEQIVLYKTVQLIGIDLSFFRLQAVRVEVADHGVRALAFSLRGVAVGQWAAVSHLPFEGKLKKN